VKERRKGGNRITIEGELKFEGQDIIDVMASDRVKRGIVLCRERHPVFRDCSTEENLKIAGFLRPTREVRESTELAYETFPHLTRLRNRKGGLLSGGERQMLSLGMAIVAHPRLLLLDEPLLGLSPLLQDDILRAMHAI